MSYYDSYYFFNFVETVGDCCPLQLLQDCVLHVLSFYEFRHRVVFQAIHACVLLQHFVIQVHDGYKEVVVGVDVHADLFDYGRVVVYVFQSLRGNELAVL